MNRKTIYILILILGIFFSDMAAQNSQTLYYMNIPQNHLLNPALRPSNSVYIGLPAISGINLNINNNFVNFSDIFMNGQSSDSLITFLHPDNNIEDFISKVKDKNSLEPELSVQLFGLGFNAGKDLYLFFDVNERLAGNIVFPGDIIKLGLLGNEQFIGSKIDMSSLRGDFKYYREYGLGFSRDFTTKLRIGVKAKLLKGIGAASIKNRSLGISINDDYTHTLDADLTVNASYPMDIYLNPDNGIDSIVFDNTIFDTFKSTLDFMLGKKNTGLGIDIGATYDISDKLKVSASLTDIGFIKWKRYVSNLQAKSQFEFSGLNMTDVISGTITIDSLIAQVTDSLQNSFKVSNSNDPFTTGLPFGVTLGGSYNVTKSFSVGILSYSRFIGKQIKESLTLSANLNLSNAFSTSLSYTMANHRFDNLGFGLAFRPGITQFYFIADRIPVTWNKVIIDGSTIPLPTSWNTINLRLGMNLTFGNRVKKKNDKPMIIVE